MDEIRILYGGPRWKETNWKNGMEKEE
jgi:hypothetical protein